MNKFKDLKPEWRVFSEEYVIDWNATRAYNVAYPDCTVESAKTSGSRLLTDGNVQEYIEYIQEDLTKLAGISALKNINTLMEIIEAEGNNKERATDRIKAIEVINKMTGFNAPEKTEAKVEGEVTKKTVISFRRNKK